MSTQTAIFSISNHNNKSKRLCKDCGRQFVINPNKQTITSETKLLGSDPQVVKRVK